MDERDWGRIGDKIFLICPLRLQPVFLLRENRCLQLFGNQRVRVVLESPLDLPKATG